MYFYIFEIWWDSHICEFLNKLLLDSAILIDSVENQSRNTKIGLSWRIQVSTSFFKVIWFYINLNAVFRLYYMSDTILKIMVYFEIIIYFTRKILYLSILICKKILYLSVRLWPSWKMLLKTLRQWRKSYTLQNMYVFSSLNQYRWPWYSSLINF